MDCPRCFAKALALLIAICCVCETNISASLANAGQFHRVDAKTRNSQIPDIGFNEFLTPRVLDLASHQILAGCYLTGPAFANEALRMIPVPFTKKSKEGQAQPIKLRPIKSAPFLVFVLPQEDAHVKQGVDESSLTKDANNLWINFHKLARLDLFGNSAWEPVNSDLASMDGMFVPKSMLPTESGSSISAELASEIFEDPYWTYYSDVDRWGIVLKLDNSRLARTAPSVVKSPAASKNVPAVVARSHGPVKISTAGYRKTSTLNSDVTSRFSMIGMSKKAASQIKSISVQSVRYIENVIDYARQQFNKSRVKPLVEKLKYRVAHREIEKGLLVPSHVRQTMVSKPGFDFKMTATVILANTKTSLELAVEQINDVGAQVLARISTSIENVINRIKTEPKKPNATEGFDPSFDGPFPNYNRCELEVF